MEDKQDKFLTRKVLAPVLNTIIGQTPKTLPSELTKGDIIRYNDYLYQYKGLEPKTFNIPTENEFKKVGIRYLNERFKKTTIPTLDEVYGHLFRSGMSGVNYLGETVTDEIELKRYYYYYYYYYRGRGGYGKDVLLWVGFEKFKKPIIVTLDNFEEILKKNEQEKWTKELEQSIKLNNKLKTATQKELLEISKTDFSKGTLGINIGKSESTLRALEFLCTKFTLVGENRITSYVETDNYECGLYQKQFYDDIKYLEKTQEPTEFYYESIIKYDNEGPGKDGYSISQISFREKLYHSPKFSCYNYEIPDIVRNDSNSSSLKKEHQFGYYAKVNEEGYYKIHLKAVYTNIAQTNDGNRLGGYPMVSNSNKLANGDYSECVWDKSKQYDTAVTFKYFNGKLEFLKFETQDARVNEYGGVQNVLVSENLKKYVAIDTVDNYIFINSLTAVYSYDDNGQWNAWAFCYLIPPLDLEYLGEELENE